MKKNMQYEKTHMLDLESYYKSFKKAPRQLIGQVTL